jgi:hypothetical protein
MIKFANYDTIAINPPIPRPHLVTLHIGFHVSGWTDENQKANKKIKKIFDEKTNKKRSWMK